MNVLKSIGGVFKGMWCSVMHEKHHKPYDIACGVYECSKCGELHFDRH